MAEDERRRRFLMNWYAVYGAAGQTSSSVTPQEFARVGSAIVGYAIVG